MSAVRHSPSRRAEAGFGLVEALVALLVISLGMLGTASLFAHGLLTSRVALERTQAVNLAADMAERIRGNRQGAYAAAPADRGCEGAGADGCSPQQMAEHDVHDWSTRVAAALPGGVGTISVADAAPTRYSIRVAWRETGMAAGGAEQSYTLEVAVADR